MADFQNLTEVKTGSQEIFDGVILHVFKDTVALPNGKVIIERQFRYPLNQVITEIPAGKLDSLTEDRLSAAKRELEEETGYTAKEWINIGDYYPAAAYCDERITLYLARGLSLGQRHLDEDEFLNFAAVPLTELVEDVMAGRITDGKTQVAILKVARFLEKL